MSQTVSHTTNRPRSVYTDRSRRPCFEVEEIRESVLEVGTFCSFPMFTRDLQERHGETQVKRKFSRQIFISDRGIRPVLCCILLLLSLTVDSS